MPDSFYNICGFVGALLFMSAYAALQFGLVRGSSITYTVANLIAASLLLISLVQDFNAGSAVVNSVWIVISIIGLVRIYRQLRRLRFSEDEETLRMALLPNMPKTLARAFFDLGNWAYLEAGHTLTEQGAPVEMLFCVHSGRARVFSGGQDVGAVAEGFVGEINVLEGRPATASVRAEEEMRVFVVEGAALRRLVARDSDFKMAIEAALSQDTGRKLQAANMRARSGHVS